MAQQVVVQASARADTGKGAARSLRRAGKVPGVIYGHGRAAEAVTFDARELGRALTGASGSTLVDVTIDGRPTVKALIREIQRNPIKRSEFLHVDFYEVRADEAVTVDVPVLLVGTPEGVRTFGGVLDWALHTIELECLPADIPEKIEIDVSGLGLAQAIHVSDVSVPNAKILTAPEQTVATVVPPRVEAEAAEGAEEATAEPELIRKAKAEDESED